MNDTVVNVIGIGAVLIVILGCLVAHAYFIQLRCPECRQFNALVPTGKTWKCGGFPVQIMDQYRCRYCDETVWKQRPMGGGG